MTRPPFSTPEHDNADPGMDDILASIRQILTEEDNTKEGQDKPANDVLVLNASMMVPERAPERGPAAEPPPRPAANDVILLDSSMMTPAAAPSAPTPPHEPKLDSRPMNETEHDAPASAPAPLARSSAEPNSGQNSLIAPQAVAAAASSVGELMRTLASERTVPLGRANVTIEDLVREQLRPMLKEWLDANLPGVVDRLVRVEIERLVSRMAP